MNWQTDCISHEKPFQRFLMWARFQFFTMRKRKTKADRLKEKNDDSVKKSNKYDKKGESHSNDLQNAVLVILFYIVMAFVVYGKRRNRRRINVNTHTHTHTHLQLNINTWMIHFGVPSVCYRVPGKTRYGTFINYISIPVRISRLRRRTKRLLKY